VRRGTVADVMLLVTVLLWALNFSASKYILDHGFEPIPYSVLRYGAAGTLFLLVVVVVERTLRIGTRDRRLVAAAVVLLVANQLSFVFALDLSTATTVALLFGTLPIWTALLARIAGVERLGRRFWIAAPLSFAGVVLVTAGSDGGLSGNVLGNILGVAAAATWGGYSVLIKPLMERYSPYRLSAILLLAVFAVLGVVGAGEVAEQSLDLGGLVWLAFAFAVLGPLVLTNVLWFSAIDRVGPSRASLFANLQPFLAAVIALLLLDERLTSLQVAGGLLIAGGIAFSRGPEPEPV
jgi:drug/metabolite transporter (DMT)-like permease